MMMRAESSGDSVMGLISAVSAGTCNDAMYAAMTLTVMDI
jgi:hypothetical protein